MSSLDLYILMLLKHGINTPYGFRSRAGISLGASLPALRRLLGRRLIKEATPGPRGRREFQMTRLGEQELANIDGHLETALRDEVPELDSVLRLVACALASGKKQIALELVDKAAEKYAKSTQLANPIPDVLDDGDLPSLYVGLITYCDARLLQSHAGSLQSLRTKLGKGVRRPIKAPRKPR